jgi:tripartite-type tricarboxylate transporter receptor subunit TctC
MQCTFQFFRVFLLLFALTFGLGSPAQTFPSKPLRIVIGFPPGGGIDMVARLMAPKLSELFGQPVLIENKPGANGVLGMDFVAKAPADGHTLFLGTLGNFSVNPALYPNLPFNVDKQFVPLTELASVSFVLFVNPALPVKSVSDLVAYAKRQPDAVNFSSSSSGGLPHLAGELFASAIGAKMVHVPYKGSAASISDVMAGQVHMTFEAAAAGMPHVKSGRLRALAVTGAGRLPFLPDVPAVQETVPGFQVVNWYGMAAPAGTPKEVLARWHSEIAKVLAVPEIREKMVSMGTDPVGSSPEEFAQFVKLETAKWTRIIRDAQIRPD